MDGSLEKLDLTDTRIDVVKVFELKSMKKLKLLVLGKSEMEIVRKKLSDIEVVRELYTELEDNNLVAPVHVDVAFNARHFDFSFKKVLRRQIFHSRPKSVQRSPV